MDIEEQKRISEYFEGLYQQGITPWTMAPKSPVLGQFFELLKKQHPDEVKILDIGCGNGWVSVLAAKEGFRVWGVDSSSTAIQEANKAAKEFGVEEKCHFEVGDALDLPHEDQFFDVLIDRGLFHHILPENRALYFKNILRVLKPNALMYLSVFSGKNPLGIGQLFKEELIEDLFGKHFKIISSQEDEFPPRAPAHLLHFILKRLE